MGGGKRTDWSWSPSIYGTEQWLVAGAQEWLRKVAGEEGGGREEGLKRQRGKWEDESDSRDR